MADGGEARWLGCHGDVWALADDVERDRAVTTIGRPSDVTASGMLAAFPVWSEWQSQIAEAIGGATGGDISARLDEWAEKAAADEDAAAPLYVAALQADLGGQLFVRTVEVPEAQQSRSLRDERAPSFLSMPFDEAIQFFLARRLITPDEFGALSDAARQRAFTATRLATDELRARAYRMLLATLREGGTQQGFSQALRDEELSLGVTPSSPGYLETVFRTNVQAAYGAGRYRQITSPVVQAARPLVEYRTARDARVRPSHAALDGLLFRQDDPTWPRFAPPCGFNCRCGVVARPASYAEGREGKLVGSAADLSVRPDPGFDAPPSLEADESGASVAAPRPGLLDGVPAQPTRSMERLREALDQLDAEAAAEVLRGERPVPGNRSALPPIRIEVAPNGAVEINDGNHRIAVAREMGIPEIEATIRRYRADGSYTETTEVVPVGSGGVIYRGDATAR